MGCIGCPELISGLVMGLISFFGYLFILSGQLFLALIGSVVSFIKEKE